MNDQLVQLITSDVFQQLFPFLVLFFIPFTAIFLVKTGPRLSSSFYTLVMVLESLLPWNWNWGSSGSSGKTSQRSRKKHNKAGSAVDLLEFETLDGYYPGLVNISGTYCFMNSTVQALSSLSYLQPHLDAMHTKAEVLDVPTPVVDTLRDLCHRLNTPHSRPSALRPLDLISVLSTPSEVGGRSNSLFNSREHQDAQELFQLITERIKFELSAIDKEGVRDRGLGALSQESQPKEVGKSVFDGLTANRRSCVVCGYTEAVMHFPLDNWQLPLPQMNSACFLEDCFSDYTRLEVLRDCICRNCSMHATHKRLLSELETLQKVENPSSSKKKKIKEIKRMEASVKAAIEQGRIEDDIPGLRMEKVFSAMSTKQAMIARPPPVLALHINRSMHFTHYAAKNNARVIFPEVLDLTPFTTSGNLSVVPTSSMSTPTPTPPPQPNSSSPFTPNSGAPSRSRTGTPTLESQNDVLSRTIYRLSAVVCHYGAHSYGHYVCFRRKPRRTGVDRWKPPHLVIETTTVKQEEPDSETEAEDAEGYEWDDFDPETAPGTGRGWLRISDDSVSECGIESVLQEGSGAFMLYYERAVILPSPSSSVAMNGSASPYPIAAGNGVLKGGYQGVGVGVGTPLDSEETLKPETMTTRSAISVNTISSLGSLEVAQNKDVGLSSSLPTTMTSWSGSGSPPISGRIVRSVAAGRPGRSMSAAPSLNGSVISSNSPSIESPPPSSSSKPIPMPNGHPREVDGFESIDADEASSPARATSLPHTLESSLSTSPSSPSSPSKKKRKPKSKSKGHPNTNPLPVDLKA